MNSTKTTSAFIRIALLCALCLTIGLMLPRVAAADDPVESSVEAAASATGELDVATAQEDPADPALDPAANVPVYRLYNWRTSEHLYTTNRKEYEFLPGNGWVREGIAWYAPSSSRTPVYRLYNPRSGDHHYTTSSGERDALVARHGWRSEGTAFYSDDSRRVAVYRVYNGRLRRGQHHFTTSSGERGSLVSRNGWRDEGTAFYAAANGKLMTVKYPGTIPAGFYNGETRDGYPYGYILHPDGRTEYVPYGGGALRISNADRDYEDLCISEGSWYPAPQYNKGGGKGVVINGEAYTYFSNPRRLEAYYPDPYDYNVLHPI